MNERSLPFTKMHGLGNDFVVIDNLSGELDLDATRIRALADRRTGIGFDQLLIVQVATRDDCDFDYRIHNADGDEVEHCGNGARCFARFVREKGLTDQDVIPVNTTGGRIVLRVQDDERVSVDMGVPAFAPAAVPFQASAQALRYAIDVKGETVHGAVLAIGNPHLVVPVEDVRSAPVSRLGPALESHPRFPARVNVGFAQTVSRGELRLRVFERGVGETRACGTGACAAVAAGIAAGELDREVTVWLPGGALQIAWPGAEQPIEMTGPCSTVFEGRTRM